MKTYDCSFCRKIFKRYKSTVYNENKVYCSRDCKNKHQSIINKGKNNPNYKHGKACWPQYCECGNIKDERSDKCSRCAKCSFPIEGKVLNKELINTLAKECKIHNCYETLAKTLGYSRATIARWIKLLNIDISHFRPGRGRPMAKEEIFSISKKRNGAVKNCIIINNIFPYICSFCGLGPTWNNKELTLELDHINGNSCDNRIENLRFLCPNCHSQTDTNRGKKRKGKKPKK